MTSQLCSPNEYPTPSSNRSFVDCNVSQVITNPNSGLELDMQRETQAALVRAEVRAKGKHQMLRKLQKISQSHDLLLMTGMPSFPFTTVKMHQVTAHRVSRQTDCFLISRSLRLRHSTQLSSPSCH